MADASAAPRTRRGHLVGIAVAVGLVAAVFVFVLPRIADYRDVWEVLAGLSARDAALLAAATVLNVVTFAPPWMAALPGLGFRQALALAQRPPRSRSSRPRGQPSGWPGRTRSFAPGASAAVRSALPSP